MLGALSMETPMMVHSNVTAGLQCLDQKKILSVSAEEDKTLHVVALLQIKGNTKVFNLRDAWKKHSLAQ